MLAETLRHEHDPDEDEEGQRQDLSARFSTKSPMGFAEISMTMVDTIIATTMTQIWSAMPTAVITESSEKTTSTIMI